MNRSAYILFLWIALLCCLLLGCEIVEPDPIEGTPARGLPLSPVTIPGIAWGERVNGVINVTPPVSILTSDVIGFQVGFDNTIVTPLMATTATVSFDVTGVPAGQHRIVYFVYTTLPYEGMLGLLGAPRRSYYSIITVDHTITGLPVLPPPSAPTNVQTAWTGASPRITWNATTDTNFTEYVINRIVPGVDGAASTIARLTDRLTTSYEDLAYFRMYGSFVSYAVGVSNRSATTLSDYQMTYKGTMLAVPSVNLIVPRPTTGEIIMISDQFTKWAVVSTSTQTVLRSAVFAEQDGPKGGWNLSADGATMYVARAMPDASARDTVYNVTAYDVGTLAPVRDMRLPFKLRAPIDVEVGLTDRIYAGDDSNRVWVLNGLTGAVLDSAKAPDGDALTSLTMSIARDRLAIAILGRETAEYRIVLYDVTNPDPVPLGMSSDLPRVQSAHWNQSGSRLVVIHTDGAITVLDGTTLNTLANLPRLPDLLRWHSYTSVCVMESTVLLGYEQDSEHAWIAQVDLTSGTIQKAWHTHRVASAVYRTSESGTLYTSAISINRTLTWIFGPNE